MEDLSLRKPPALPIKVGDTSPVGEQGAVVWSTTDNCLLQWNGTNWLRVGYGGSLTYQVRNAVTQWYFFWAVQNTATTISSAAGAQDFIFFIPQHNIVINELALHVSTGATGTVSFGIYSNQVSGGNNYPYQLLGSVNNVDTSTAEFKSGTLASPITLFGGNIYWLSYKCSAAVSFRAMLGTSIGVPSNTLAGIHVFVLRLSGTGSSLVTPAPTSGYTTTSGNNVVAIAYR